MGPAGGLAGGLHRRQQQADQRRPRGHVGLGRSAFGRKAQVVPLADRTEHVDPPAGGPLHVFAVACSTGSWLLASWPACICTPILPISNKAFSRDSSCSADSSSRPRSTSGAPAAQQTELGLRRDDQVRDGQEVRERRGHGGLLQFRLQHGTDRVQGHNDCHVGRTGSWATAWPPARFRLRHIRQHLAQQLIVGDQDRPLVRPHEAWIPRRDGLAIGLAVQFRRESCA